MQRFVITAISLIIATVTLGGCEPFEEPHLTLHALCESGDATPERIQAFLDLGVDVNSSDAKGRPPLHHIAEHYENAEIATILLKAGADVNAKGKYGRTPLHRAARSNQNPEIVASLIEAGGNVDPVNSSGRTPLHLAVGNGNPDIVAVLLEAGANVNAEDNWEETPLDLAEAVDGAANNTDRLRAAGGRSGKDLP